MAQSFCGRRYVVSASPQECSKTLRCARRAAALTLGSEEEVTIDIEHPYTIAYDFRYSQWRFTLVNATGQPLAHFIGSRIKELRAQRHLSLRELASSAGVSAAMVSEIERGKKSPTITLLAAIATALAVPTSYLFERDEAVAGISLVRRTDHRVVDIGPGAVNIVLGHPVKGSNLHFVRLELQKGASHEEVSHPAGSIERAHVEAGSLELTVGNDKAELVAGDSCSFLADRPHWYRNTGRGTAKVYLVVDFRNE